MSHTNKSRFMPDEEEIERQKKEILIEMNKTNSEIRKEKKKRVFIIISIITISILLIKIIFGTIYIPNVFKYPFNKTRFYKVTLNEELISTEYYLTQRLPVLPYLIYLEREYFDSYIIKGDNDGVRYVGDHLDKFIVNIESYSCYFKNSQTKCKDINSNMKKNDDTNYKRLEIWRYSNPVEKMYDGEFINDITPYIKGKGRYTVVIYADYSFIETKISFSLVIKK